MDEKALIKLYKKEMLMIASDLEALNVVMKEHARDLISFHGMLPDDEEVKNLHTEINNREALVAKMKQYAK